jgi:hypothetical protein
MWLAYQTERGVVSERLRDDGVCGSYRRLMVVVEHSTLARDGVWYCQEGPER